MKLLLSLEIFRVDVCDVIALQIEDAKRVDSPERMLYCICGVRINRRTSSRSEEEKSREKIAESYVSC